MEDSRRARLCPHLGVRGAVVLAAACLGCAPLARAQSLDELQSLSISELANVQVSSAAKSTESLSQAPAAIYVITHDEIVRSGAKTLPQILRLAPNLFVAQTSAHSWVITARGLSGESQAQSFANKLLVLIDGRSVYDPLFSGVDWGELDVVPDDIERIEVISGPGATLWGANAVNGVINIITRASYQTQGAFADATLGTDGESATLRYGGRINDDLTFRLYAKDLAIGDTRTASGLHAADHWYKPQAGFRLDWTPNGADSVWLEGDGYLGQVANVGAPDSNFSGADLNAHWDHLSGNGDDLQVQAYFNREEAGPTPSGVANWFNTLDLEAQDQFAWGARQSLVWGAGVRETWYAIKGTPQFTYAPARGRLLLGDLFGQDTVALTPTVDVIAGLKLEDDPYSGLSALPSLRLTWQAEPQLLVWASAQRAIRAPTPFDTAPRETVGGLLLLVGNPDFEPETLNAYEIGVRAQPLSRATFSASVFYNQYDNLRTIEFGPSGLPLTWGNRMKGRTYGLQAWADFQAARWWRLSPAIDLFGKTLAFKPGASGLLGTAQAGDDPPVQASLRSAMTFGRRVTFDTVMRYVGALPDPAVPAYAELDVSLLWNLTRRLQLGVAGFNLLHDHHLEFPASGGATYVPRTAQIEVRANF